MAFKCPICLAGEDEEESEIVAINCGHIFHLQCVENGLLSSERCPLCRKVVERSKIIKIFLNTAQTDTLTETESDKLKLKSQEKEINELRKDAKFLGQRLRGERKANDRLEENIKKLKMTVLETESKLVEERKRRREAEEGNCSKKIFTKESGKKDEDEFNYIDKKLRSGRNF